MKFLAIVATTASCGALPLGACIVRAPDEGPGVSTESIIALDAGDATVTDAGTGVIWTVGFERTGGMSPGNLHALTRVAPGLTLSRASAATVQISASSIDTTPGVDDARLGSTGTFQGLVIEEARRNIVSDSRNASVAPWVNVPTTAGIVVTPLQPSPDGSKSASRVQIPAGGHMAVYQTGANGGLQVDPTKVHANGAPYAVTGSLWVHPTVAGGSVQWGIGTNWEKDTTTYAGGGWVRSVLPPIMLDPKAGVGAPQQVAAFTLAAGINYSYFEGMTGGPDKDEAIDQVVDLAQAEIGAFATEPIVSTGAAATRAGERLHIVNGAGALDGGQLSLYVKMVPKGSASQYTSPAYLWSIDANNYALFDPRSQTVTLAVNGTVSTSAAAVGAVSPDGGGGDAGVAELFTAGQVVEWFVRAGSGAGLVQLRVKGGDTVTLIDAPVAGAMAAPDGIDLLSSGTSNQFSSWVERITIGHRGSDPLAPVATVSCTSGDAGTSGKTVVSARGSFTWTTSRDANADGADTTKIVVDGVTYMTSTYSRSGAGSTAVTTIDTVYGPQVSGVQHVHLQATGSGSFSGTVDGRAIEPFSPSAPPAGAFSYADGKPAPAFVITPDIKSAVDALTAAAAGGECPVAQASAAAVVSPSPNAGGDGVPAAHPVVPDNGQASGTPGHIDTPEFSSACQECKVACIVAGGACGAGVAAGCAATLVGYPICLVAAEAACLVAEVGCQGACEFSGGPCRPVLCGNGACNSNDTCLNTGARTCCGPGTNACAGAVCCGFTNGVADQCLASSGSCCPAGQNSCGGTCCAPGETVCAGAAGCCQPENACGNACCPIGGTCLDASKSLCCGGLGQVACGDTCCALGDVCVANGNFCCPRASACGTVCCGAGQTCLNAGSSSCGVPALPFLEYYDPATGLGTLGTQTCGSTPCDWVTWGYAITLKGTNFDPGFPVKLAVVGTTQTFTTTADANGAFVTTISPAGYGNTTTQITADQLGSSTYLASVTVYLQNPAK